MAAAIYISTSGSQGFTFLHILANTCYFLSIAVLGDDSCFGVAFVNSVGSHNGALEGFEEAELVYSASYLGIRESRRITCDYRLVLEDFQRQAVFDDEIGRYSYNIDIHSPTNDKAGYETFIRDHTSLRYKRGESYGIPYRALTVSGIENLLTAGRCVCTDRYMQSSIRVMPGCYITGQAAGIGAAVVCDAHSTNVHDADVHEIQKRLVHMGGYLPNYKD